MIEYCKETFFQDNLKYVIDDINNKTITNDCEICINGTICKVEFYKDIRVTIKSPLSNYRFKLKDKYVI